MDVQDPQGLLPQADRAWLRDRAAAALAELGAAGEVRVRLCDDAEMSRVHERFCGDPATTDVLTFSLGAGPHLDTDLYVCVDEARRAATARGHAPAREALLYVVHGVLHCLGMDDRDEAERAAMHEREDRVLAAIGVGATYGRRAADARAEGH